jgi:hypothetical protein
MQFSLSSAAKCKKPRWRGHSIVYRARSRHFDRALGVAAMGFGPPSAPFQPAFSGLPCNCGLRGIDAFFELGFGIDRGP